MSNLPVAVDGDFGDTLDDLDDAELAVPRVKPDRHTGKFKDPNSGQSWDSLRGVVLGLVRGRVLWSVEVEDDAMPMCKSLDFETGLPSETFPWDAHGGEVSETLNCASCPLKEWGSHPTRDVPWCNEQMTLPVLLTDNGGYQPVIVTFARSQLKPTKGFLGSFKRSRTPAFSVEAEISLTQLKRGDNPYVVPEYKRLGATDEGDWGYFAETFRGIRGFLQAKPQAVEAIEATSSAAEVVDNVAPVADDEIPF